MVSKQPKPRNWCNCIAIQYLLTCDKHDAEKCGNITEAARYSSEIARHIYAHHTGRCRFEYDPDETPIGVEC